MSRQGAARSRRLGNRRCKILQTCRAKLQNAPHPATSSLKLVFRMQHSGTKLCKKIVLKKFREIKPCTDFCNFQGLGFYASLKVTTKEAALLIKKNEY